LTSSYNAKIGYGKYLNLKDELFWFCLLFKIKS
jgi:hypothetical protein